MSHRTPPSRSDPRRGGCLPRLGWVCSDEFSLRYSDLVTGGYDCVDRIVLNAFFPLGHNPGGFRAWWRWLHGDSDAELDNTHPVSRWWPGLSSRHSLARLPRSWSRTSRR